MLKLENAGLSLGASPFPGWEVFLASCPSLGTERQTVGRQRAGECLGSLPGARLSNQASASLSKSCPGPVITGRNVCSSYSQRLMKKMEVCARFIVEVHGQSAGSCRPLGESRSCRPGGEEQGRQVLAPFLRCASASKLCVQIGSQTQKPSMCLSLGAYMGYTYAMHMLGNLVMAKCIPLRLQSGLLGVLGAWDGGTPKQGSLSGSILSGQERGVGVWPQGLRVWYVQPSGAGCFTLHLNSAQQLLE